MYKALIERAVGAYYRWFQKHGHGSYRQPSGGFCTYNNGLITLRVGTETVAVYKVTRNGRLRRRPTERSGGAMSSTGIPPLPPGLEAADLRETCYHEAGHAVVAKNYGISAEFTVERVGEPTIYDRAWVGQTRFFNTATAFQNAVISWSGALAEALMDEPPAKWQEYIGEVAANVLEEYYDQEPSLSPTDREWIDETKQFTRSFNRACALVARHAAEIAEQAEQMIARNNSRPVMAGMECQRASGNSLVA